MNCVGCKTGRHYYEDLKSCIRCGDIGPYCVECPTCNGCETEYPADWSCGTPGHDLIHDQLITKCVDCNDYDYCKNCVKKCSCGQGEDHYLCIAESCEHRCKHRGCNNYVCKQYGSIPFEDEKVWCKDHYPEEHQQFCNKIKDLVKKDKRLREELELE